MAGIATGDRQFRAFVIRGSLESREGATTTGVLAAKVARRVIPASRCPRADSGDRPGGREPPTASLLLQNRLGKSATANLPLLTALVWGKPTFGFPGQGQEVA